MGIVGDVREGPGLEPGPVAYVSTWQYPQGWYTLTVRTPGDAAPLVAPIRRALHDLDPDVPLLFPRTTKQVLGDSLARQRLPMAFTAAFALLELVLAALGIYGVTAYSVTTRTREMGVRTALGSRRADILWLVLRQGLTTAAIGLLIGLPLAAAASRVLGSLLYGVTTHDLLTFLGAPAVLLAASTAACLVPARRAASADPMEALRYE